MTVTLGHMLGEQDPAYRSSLARFSLRHPQISDRSPGIGRVQQKVQRRSRAAPPFVVDQETTYGAPNSCDSVDAVMPDAAMRLMISSVCAHVASRAASGRVARFVKLSTLGVDSV